MKEKTKNKLVFNIMNFLTPIAYFFSGSIILALVIKVNNGSFSYINYVLMLIFLELCCGILNYITLKQHTQIVLDEYLERYKF